MIRIKTVIILILISISCNRSHEKQNNLIEKKTKQHLTISEEKKNINDSICIKNFKNIRQLIYEKQTSRLKKYFSFPINGSDIWNLVMLDNEDKSLNITKGFSEKDFDTYFDKLFGKYFIKSLLKVKSKELFEKGEYTTPNIIENNVQYYLFTTYNKNKGELILSINSKHNDEGDVYETSIIYFFKFDSNCDIKFEKIMLAG